MAKCGGCEAAIPRYSNSLTVGFSDFTATDGGEYQHDPVVGPEFEGASGSDVYTALAPTLDVLPGNGECNADCTQLTSCDFTLTLTLTVTLITTDPNGSGPALFFTPPWGGGQQSMTKGTPVTEEYDPVDGVYTITIAHTFEDTITPGCDTTVSFTLADTDFDIDSITGGAWTKSAGDDDEDTDYEFECEPCDGASASLDVTTQASGKQENQRAIGGSASMAAQAAQEEADDTGGCGGCAAVGLEVYDSATFKWVPAGDTQPTTEQGFGGSDGSQTYDVSEIKIWHNPYDGACVEDSSSGGCTADYSCWYTIGVELNGSVSSTDPNWEGPDFTHTPPPGWGTSLVLGDPPHYGKTFDVDEQTESGGIYTTPVKWSWDYSFEPGCNSSIESAVSADDFIVAGAEFNTFTNIPELPKERIRLRMGCTKCEKKKKKPTGGTGTGGSGPGSIE